jgi:hypothetical protein
MTLISNLLTRTFTTILLWIGFLLLLSALFAAAAQTPSPVLMFVIEVVIAYYVMRWILNKWAATVSIKEFNGTLVEFNKHVLAASNTTPFRMPASVATNLGVGISTDEQLLIAIPCYLQRKVRTGSEYQGGQRGVRVTPIKGLSFTLGGHRGRFVSTHDQQTDPGHLIITDSRVVFKGSAISFALPLHKVQGTFVTNERLTFDVTSRDVPDFDVVFANQSHAIAASQLLHNPNASLAVG